MLSLLVGGVAGAHRPGPLVAGQVLEHPLVQVAPAVDAVDNLQVALIAFHHVAHEREIVTGLPFEAERVQPPQREGRVAYPAEAVVPVPFAARCLGQRGGRRGGDGPGGREGQALKGQGAARQVAAPAVIGEAAVGQPVLPVVRGPHQPLVGVFVAVRYAAAPGQRAETGVACLQQRPGPGARSLQAEAHVRGQLERQVKAGRLDDRLGVAAVGMLPSCLLAPVVKHRHTVHRELHVAVHAAHHAQQHVLSVVVGGRPDVRAALGMLMPPRAHDQTVPHDDPALAAIPAGFQHHGPRQVAPVGRHVNIVGTEPEPSGVPVQHRAEDARAVHPRQAHPLDRSAGRHQRGDLAVGQERVVRDRRVRRELVTAARRPLTGAVR